MMSLALVGWCKQQLDGTDGTYCRPPSSELGMVYVWMLCVSVSVKALGRSLALMMLHVAYRTGQY